jgi:hypothetical protein
MGAGGGTTPGGVNNSVQYNNSGVLGGLPVTTRGALQADGLGHNFYSETHAALVTDPPYNAVCNGSTDDTAAFQAAIDQNPNIRLPYNVQCNITSLTENNYNLTIYGNGSIIASTITTGNMIHAVNQYSEITLDKANFQLLSTTGSPAIFDGTNYQLIKLSYAYDSTDVTSRPQYWFIHNMGTGTQVAIYGSSVLGDIGGTIGNDVAMYVEESTVAGSQNFSTALRVLYNASDSWLGSRTRRSDFVCTGCQIRFTADNINNNNTLGSVWNLANSSLFGQFYSYNTAAFNPFNTNPSIGDFVWSSIASTAAGHFVNDSTAIAPLYRAAGTPIYVCNAGSLGASSNVSDATIPSANGHYTSGGTYTTSIYCAYDGSSYFWALGTNTGSTGGGGGSTTAQWQRQGVVIAPVAADPSPQAQEPSAMLNSTPEILTSYSQVVSMTWTCGWWYTGGGGTGVGICGGESPDGITPPMRLSSEPIISDHARSWLMPTRIGGNFVLYATELATGNVDIYTGSTLAGLTRTHANVIRCGSNGTEVTGSTGNTSVWQISGSNWGMLYECVDNTTGYAEWLATSSDSGVTWTKYQAAPVILGAGAHNSQCAEGGGAFAFLNSGKLHVWVHCGPANVVIPTPYIYHFVSTDGTGHSFQIDSSPTLQSQTYDEGLGLSTGQIADAYLLDMGSLNRTTLYYGAYTNGCPSQTTCSVPSYIKAAVINQPLATIATETQSDGSQNRNIAPSGYTFPPTAFNSAGVAGNYAQDISYFYYYDVASVPNRWQRIAKDATWIGYQDFANFSGTAGTNISSYTTQAGKTFVIYAADGTTQSIPKLTGTSSIVLAAGTSATLGDSLDTLTPASANYTVKLTCTYAVSDATPLCSVFGRAASGANTYLIGQCAPTTGVGACQLYQTVTGSTIQLGTSANITWAVGDTHTVSLTVSGTTATLYFDGVATTATGTTSIVAAGQTGLRISGGSTMTATNFTVQ